MLIIICLLIKFDILNLKYFFISAALSGLIVSLDVIYQYFFGFNIIGLKSHDYHVSSFFGDEHIAGGFIEVLEDKVSILATEVLSSEQIDVSKFEEKISKYNSDLNASEIEIDKDIIQKNIDKYQAMIEFKNSN